MAFTGVTKWGFCSYSGVGRRSRDDDHGKGSLLRVLRGGAGCAMPSCLGNPGPVRRQREDGKLCTRASVVVSLGKAEQGKQAWDWPV